MRIKKYEAETMNEAIAKVKRDFGSKAIILHSKNTKKGGLLGFLGKDCVEVLAGIDINIIEKQDPKKAIIKETKKPETRLETRTNETQTAEIISQNSIEPEPKIETFTEITAENPGTQEYNDRLNELQEGINKVLFRLGNNSSKLPYRIPGLDNIHAGLLSCGISKRILDEMFVSLFDNFNGRELKNPEKIKNYISEYTASKIKVTGHFELNENQTNYLAFIGPTGVGKTTTIAKLAANFTLFEGKSVGLITIDTFRIAAIEQLKTFAQIMNVELEVVYTPQELLIAMDKFKKHELVLIDTAGRSPHNKEHLYELRNFLAVADTKIIKMLVLSATSKLENLLNAIHRFESVGYENLILSKMDETNTFGSILDIATATNKPISYLSTGQNVPEDLEIAQTDILAKKVLKNMKGHW